MHWSACVKREAISFDACLISLISQSALPLIEGTWFFYFLVDIWSIELGEFYQTPFFFLVKFLFAPRLLLISVAFKWQTLKKNFLFLGHNIQYVYVLMIIKHVNIL